MKLEIRAAIPEAVDARIGPDIRAVAAVLAEFDVVDVRCVPRLEDADELVLGTIERPHAGVGLRPDADILTGIWLTDEHSATGQKAGFVVGGDCLGL